MSDYNKGTDRAAVIVQRRGLPHVKAKLAGEAQVTVAFLGGSITEGAGASAADKTSWRALTALYLRDRFGKSRIRSINAGVGGTDSTLGAHRLREHVLSVGNIDLLFVEFSVNDGSDREETIRGMEGIVRQCRRLSPGTDLCFIYTGSERNLTRIRPYPIAVHEEVAEHYGIPSVDFAAGIYRMLQNGEVAWSTLAPDGYHPNDEGHEIYAGFLRGGLNELLSTEADFLMLDHCESLSEEPLMTGNYQYADMLPFELADDIGDYHIRKLPLGSKLMNWRYATEHRYSDHPNASFTFTVEGQSGGLLLLCGPDTGILEYSINGGSFVRVNPFDEWCLNAYRPVSIHFPRLRVRGPISIVVRNTGLKDKRSLGTGMRVLKLLAN
ncbi:SGNH/GDSL hydrolase family protein [Paenibacillus lautus]|uniref:SGNH/GDSL hydrolase family protein n=1 Tax=Paenibacillus lautus TaxID=1401 RepID=UPI002DB80FB9|nr:SGNH/GDSL hydrolase family protein [Paenibacillus lautus]MEC0201213.1 SGNH/GDSL hydrolase family protein [Paenibacillus lautus]